MRAGGCTVQQTLTSEAASVLKHSLSLARRRGHAQVTPLHVAATLLSSRVSLLRRACLKSHPHSSSHPLQCRALELCLNVALNRLPTTPGPLLHAQPSLSNALIAALKRAQAHQRRGCIEQQQQQQPLLAIKVELEQLIISILDDPSVSRVMREAGFSSTCVKNNLEDSSASSVLFQCYNSGSTNGNGILSSPSPSPSPAEPIINHSSFWQTHFLNCYSDQNPLSSVSTPKKNLMTPILKESDKEEDLKLVVEVLLRKRKRNTVIVGDSLATTECLVEMLMGKVERGEVPNELRSAHFIKFQFPPVTLKFMKREDVEMKIADLRRKVGSLVSGGGAVIYAGDLKWAVESTDVGGESVHWYNPVEHLVSEIGRLVSDYTNSNSKVWLMGTASYQTYMRCQMKQPSLDIQWGLQPVSVPSGGLGLSLHASSSLDTRMTIIQNPTKLFAPIEDQDKLTCCAECTSNFEKDAGFLRSGQQKKSDDLPYWLQPPKTDSSCKDDLLELRRKWNRLCHSLHHPRPNQLHPSFNNQNLSNKSCSFASPYSWWPNTSQQNQESTSRQERSKEFTSCSIDFGLANGNPKDHSKGLRLDSLKRNENKDEKITLALGTSLLPEKWESEIDASVLNKQLQENIPWQSEIIPSITEALLESKSDKSNGIWLLIEGDDWFGKQRLAQTIVDSFLVSPDNFVYINLRRDSHATPCSEILSEALRKQERSVVLIEEIDYADSHFLKFLSDGCTKASFSRAIFIVAKGDSSRYESGTNVVQMKIYVEELLGSVNLESDCKRKAEWDMSNKAKNQKIDDTSENVFSRQSSSNTLDLNMLAEEEDNEEYEEIKTNDKPLNELLGLVKARFVFSRSVNQSSQMTECFTSRLKDSYQDVFGSEKGGYFSVDQSVIERIVNGSGILANLFEKWLKDVFQTSLQMVKKGGKEAAVRLSLDGKEDSSSDDGYMGTNLPNIIPVSFKE